MTKIKATLGLLLAVVVAGAFAVTGSASPRSGDLQVTKDCSEYNFGAGEHCTIQLSSLNAIASGMRVVYASAAGASGLDSDLVLDGPGNNDAFGHVTLDAQTLSGEVTFSGDRAVQWVPRARRRHARSPAPRGAGTGVQLHAARSRPLSGEQGAAERAVLEWRPCSAPPPSRPPGDQALGDQPRDKPVLPPWEPARQLLLWRDHGSPYPGDHELGQPAVLGRLREALVPARQLARVAVRVLVHDAAGDDRAAALERCAQPLQLSRREAELELQVVEVGRPGLGEVAQGGSSSRLASSARQSGSSSRAVSGATSRLFPR